MAFVTKFLKQTAVLWKTPVPGQFGKYTFDAGIEINVRWEEKMVRIRNDKNIEILSRAEVMLDTEIEVGEYLYLGTLDLLSSQQQLDPLLINNAYKIVSREKTPNIRATDFVRVAWLG